MAAKELPKIRAGMGDVASPFVEAWSDEDYKRATGLQVILAADGQADRAGVPALAPEVLRECYRAMLRMRALDEQARGGADSAERDASSPGTRGYEAAIVGAIAAVEAGDIVVPGRREAAAALWRGHTVAALAAGQPVPRALGVLPGSPYRGTQLPHATGIAWAMKLQAKAQAQPDGAGHVTLAYLDRETTSAEDFHAGLNFAGVFRVPAVFVCINGAADAGSVETVSETIAVKALAYGMAGVRVDGNDLFAVYAATQAAAAHARAGGGATLIEAALAKVGDRGDPLERFRLWLANQKILDASAEVALRGQVEAEVAAAFATQ